MFPLEQKSSTWSSAWLMMDHSSYYSSVSLIFLQCILLPQWYWANLFWSYKFVLECSFSSGHMKLSRVSQVGKVGGICEPMLASSSLQFHLSLISHAHLPSSSLIYSLCPVSSCTSPCSLPELSAISLASLIPSLCHVIFSVASSFSRFGTTFLFQGTRIPPKKKKKKSKKVS